jgi:hypothetical protein
MPFSDASGNEPPTRGSLWGPARAPADSPERGEPAGPVAAGPPTEPIPVVRAAPAGAFEEPPTTTPAGAEEAKNRGRMKIAIGGGAAAFAAVAAIVVVSAVGYEPAPRADPGSQALGAGSGAGAYSDLAPTTAFTEISTPSTTTVTYPTDTSVPATSASASYSSGSVPDGYQRVSGPAGVSVSIPAGWSVQQGAFASTDEADAPDGSGSTIRYSGSSTPVMSLTDAVAELEKNTPAIRKGYERLRLDEVAAGDVVWEFRFTTKAGVRRHALGWYWRADDHDYAVYASVDESRWVDFRPILDVLVQTAGPR